MSLLYEDSTEQKQAVYNGKPIRVPLGNVQLAGATAQEVEIAIENMHQAGNVQVFAECIQDDTTGKSTQVAFAYAPRVQRLDGTFCKTVQDAVTMGTATSDLNDTDQAPEVLDLPLHVRDNGSERHCMTPYGGYLYVSAEADSNAILTLWALVF